MAEEQRQLSEKEISALRFIQYVSILAQSGMQQLGKVTNPLTGKTEKNLEAARMTVELLSMLKEKTKGNLSDEEDGILSELLANLQLNYVDEAEKAAQEKKDEGKKP